MVAVCSCRACLIEVTGTPTLNGICHCNDCRRRTGSAFGWSTYWRDEDVMGATGPLRQRSVAVEPSQVRWFCSDCGSTLYWKSMSMPMHTGIAGGCFDRLPAQPEGSFVDSRRCAWISFDSSIDLKG